MPSAPDTGMTEFRGGGVGQHPRMGGGKAGSKAPGQSRVLVVTFVPLSALPVRLCPLLLPHSNKWLSQGVSGSRCECGSWGQEMAGCWGRSQESGEGEMALTDPGYGPPKVAE